ncbi:MAG: hypothetical protein ACK4ND_09480 [Cytophagaceae bacterium]
MKYLSNLLLTLSACLYLSSCKIMYIPNMQNVPLMKEQDEIRANLSFNNAQLAYALSNKIGIMANGYWGENHLPFRRRVPDSYDNEYRTRRFLAEGALGYFREIGYDFHFEIYGGGGYGGVSFNHAFSMGEENYYTRYSANMAKAFIQPAIGFQHKIVDLIFSTRVVGLNFVNINTINYSEDELYMHGLGNLDRVRYTFVEPAITIRVGYKHTKVQFQAMYSAKTNPQPLNYRAFGVSIGAHINIARRWKKQ